MAYIPEPIPPPPPPPPATRTPYWVNTNEGNHLGGDESSFVHPTDNNIIYWESVYWWALFYHGQTLEFSTFFDYPSYSYPKISLTIRVKYTACVGSAALILKVRYIGGGSSTIEIYDTGGAFVQNTYNLDSSKKVWVIESAANYIIEACFPAPVGIHSYVDIDYLAVNYKN